MSAFASANAVSVCLLSFEPHLTRHALNKEIERRTNVVGIFPNEAAVTRLVGALMPERNDEWAITRRYMTLETVAAICDTDPMAPAKIAAL